MLKHVLDKYSIRTNSSLLSFEVRPIRSKIISESPQMRDNSITLV